MPKKRTFFSDQPKDCQSECCQNSPSQQKVTSVKLKRGNLVISRQPGDKICRVVECRLYGKAVKNFAGHLSEHKMTLSQHQELPPATLHHQYIATKTNKAWMKYRKPEICFVPGCSLRQQTYLSELVKHLRREHSLSREDYRALLKTLSLKDFDGHCLAMIEEVEESAMEQAAKLMGTTYHPMHMTLDPEDSTYPTVRLVHIVIEPNAIKKLSFNEEDISIQTRENQAKGVIALLARKRFMSLEHQIAFEQSLTRSNDPWFYNPKDFSCIKYLCAICKHVHTLDIMSVDSENLEYFWI